MQLEILNEQEVDLLLEGLESIGRAAEYNAMSLTEEQAVDGLFDRLGALKKACEE